MSAIVGFFGLDGRPAETIDLERMVDVLSHRGPDGHAIWLEGAIGLGHRMLWTTPESLHEHQPLHSEDGTLTLVSDARIDNRKELIATLGLSRPSGSLITDAELILAAYQKWGKECPLRLIGDFAFAIWNKSRCELFCARDPIGVKSFYYHRQSDLFTFASEIKALFKISGVPRVLNEERVAELLVLVFEDQASTFYREIYRLPAGHCMTVSALGLRLCRYWKWDPKHELILGSDAEYEEAFRELLTESVRCRLRSTFPVGATLSGGLDSSSITCIARECLRKEPLQTLHTFSAIFPSLPEADLRCIDERSYVQTVLAGGDLVAHEVRADHLNPIGGLEDILWYQDDPLVPFNLYIHLGIYRSAREQGARVLLDGFDGDTAVSHGYERLAELARTLRWSTLLKEAWAVSRRSPDRSFSPWKVLWGYALSPLVPEALQHLWKRIRGQRHPLWDRDSVIAEAFAQRVGLAARLRQLQSGTSNVFKSAQEAHRLSLESSLIAYALELADKAAVAHFLEARYPFFDRRLLEFCLALPAEQKLRAGWSRFILRRAMQGILPPEIQWRTGKANLSPNFYRNLSAMGKETLGRVLLEDRRVVEKFVDMAALNKIYQRYTQYPSNSDAMTLFVTVGLAAWIRQTALVDSG
jgi:asparagine synthase (glutamine-hydrolysing)